MDNGIASSYEETCYGRAFVYELIHTVFGGEPDERLLSLVRSDNCRSALKRLGALSPSIERLKLYADSLLNSEIFDDEIVRCRRDYNRIVLGLGANRTAHPWESYYTNNKKLLFQVETLAVRQIFREFGYIPERYPSVADDHVALECAFMAMLSQDMIKSLEAGQVEDSARLANGQLRFVQEHLLVWLDRFAADVTADSPDGLYSLSAAACNDFLFNDVKFLESTCLDMERAARLMAAR